MLKKIVAISLMLLLAFNLFGFRIVTNILTIQADQKLEARLDVNDYDESQLIEVRIPLDVPYVGDQPDFERHYGEVEVDGIYYTYVKSKIDKGELVLKCISNNTKQKINAAGNDYFNNTNGLGHEQQNKSQHNNSNTQKNTLNDYDDRMEDFSVMRPEVRVSTTTQLYTKAITDLRIHNTPEQPPEILS